MLAQKNLAKSIKTCCVSPEIPLASTRHSWNDRLLRQMNRWVIVRRLMAKIAIIETGGKQYVAMEGGVLTIEKLADAHSKGDKVTFDKVLLTDDGSETKIGAPYVSGAKVSAE